MHVRRSVPGTPSALGLAACSYVLASCASTPDDSGLLEPPPGMEIAIAYHAGGIISGPQAILPPEEAFEPGEMLALSCTVLYVDHMPLSGVEPLETATRFVTSIEEGRPIVPNAGLLRTASLAEGDAAGALLAGAAAGDCGRCADAAEIDGALPIGATAVIFGESVEASGVDEAGRPRDRAANVLGLHISRSVVDGEPAIEIALGLRDAAPLPSDEQDPDFGGPGQEMPTDTNRMQHELVLLRSQPFDGDTRFVFAFPSPFQEGEGRAFIVYLEVREAVGEAEDSAAWNAHVALVDEAREAITESAAFVADRAEFIPPDAAMLSLLRAVLLAQEPGHVDYDALFGLARSVRANLVQDFVLTAEEPLITDLVLALADERERRSVDPEDVAQLAWVLERNAWRILGARLLEGTADLTAEGLALRHVGELGRYPTSILSIIDEVADVTSFNVRVVEENLSFLSDSHPASRIRAYEWLKRHSQVPEGYDPLADADSRREALMLFADQLARSGSTVESREPGP